MHGRAQIGFKLLERQWENGFADPRKSLAKTKPCADVDKLYWPSLSQTVPNSTCYDDHQGPQPRRSLACHQKYKFYTRFCVLPVSQMLFLGRCPSTVPLPSGFCAAQVQTSSIDVKIISSFRSSHTASGRYKGICFVVGMPRRSSDHLLFVTTPICHVNPALLAGFEALTCGFPQYPLLLLLEKLHDNRPIREYSSTCRMLRHRRRKPGIIMKNT